MNVKIENIKWLKLYRNRCIYNIINNDNNQFTLILLGMFYSECLKSINKEKSDVIKKRTNDLLNIGKCKWNFYKMYSMLYSEYELNKVCDCECQ